MIYSKFNPKIIFALFCLIIFSFINSVFLLQIFLGILSFLYLTERNLEKKKSLDVMHGILIFFLFIRIIAVIFSEYPQISIDALSKEVLFYLGFFAFSFYLKTFNIVYIKNILYVFLIAVLFTSFVGIFKFSFDFSQKAESFSSGYNAYSVYLLSALSFLLFIKHSISTVRLVTIFSLILSAIVLSMDKTNILIAFIILIIGASIGKIKYKTIAQTVLLTVVLITISLAVNGENVKNLFSGSGFTDRAVIYKGAKTLFFEHPVLGYGPKTFSKVFPFRSEFSDDNINSWQNDVFQIYFESGIIGLFGFIILISVPLGICLRLLRNKILTIFEKQLIWAALFSLCSMILSSFTSGFITSVVLNVIFVFYISFVSYIQYRYYLIKEKQV